MVHPAKPRAGPLPLSLSPRAFACVSALPHDGCTRVTVPLQQRHSLTFSLTHTRVGCGPPSRPPMQRPAGAPPPHPPRAARLPRHVGAGQRRAGAVRGHAVGVVRGGGQVRASLCTCGISSTPHCGCRGCGCECGCCTGEHKNRAQKSTIIGDQPSSWPDSECRCRVS